MIEAHIRVGLTSVDNNTRLIDSKKFVPKLKISLLWCDLQILTSGMYFFSQFLSREHDLIVFNIKIQIPLCALYLYLASGPRRTRDDVMMMPEINTNDVLNWAVET